MWLYFYRNQRLLALSILLILIWGISSVHVLPRLEDPETTQRRALVTTVLPSANAERVESLVTKVIEEELIAIPEIKNILASSRPGLSTISVDLEDSVTDTQQVLSKIRDKLADVGPELPPTSSGPTYEDIEAKAYVMLVALTWETESPVDYTTLSHLSQDLSERLRLAPGTEKVELLGSTQEEITVVIDSSRLLSLGLSAEEVSAQISASDANLPSGQLRTNQESILLEVETGVDSLDSLLQIPIRLANEQVTPLSEIATVNRGIQDPPTSLSMVNGHSATVLALMMDSNIRIDRWVERIEKQLNQFETQLPAGVKQSIIFNQSQYVKLRLDSLFLNLMLGTICVVLSTTLLMGWRAGIIVGVSLPLSIFMVFGGMRALGGSLHQISVTGLVIALGILIDNAVVVVDEIKNALKTHEKKEITISKSVNYLSAPLLASTLTSILAFMPIILLPGRQGEFLGPMALSVILALLSSFFLSLTIIPALCGKIVPKQRSSIPANNSLVNRARQVLNTGLVIPKLTKEYRKFLSSSFQRPLISGCLAFLIPLSGFLMASGLEEQFFPPVERDQFHIELELPAQVSIRQTEALAIQIRETVLAHPEVLEVNWFIGNNAPAFYYNLPKTRANVPNYAQGIVQATSGSSTQSLIETLQMELDQTIPEGRVLVRQLEQGTYVAAPIELHLYGSDLDVLGQLGEKARLALTQTQHVIHTRASLAEDIPMLQVVVDEEQAKIAGLSNSQVASRLYTELEGQVGGSVLERSEEIPVRVRVGDDVRGDLEAIASLNISSGESVLGQQANIPSPIPLSTVGKLDLRAELANITRRNGQRVNTVQGFISPDVLPSTVLAEFKENLELNSFSMPEGYALEFGGESEQRDDTIANLLSTVGVLLTLMIVSLVLVLNSFRLSLIVVLVGFCAVGLALLSLQLSGYPLGMMAILGIVGLVGVAINDAIVVLASLSANPATQAGQTLTGQISAVLEVVIDSTRHVLTTSITTVAGFIPLLVDGGKFWPPLAVCIIGGVSGTTILALYLVPCAYILLAPKPGASKSRDDGHTNSVLSAHDNGMDAGV